MIEINPINQTKLFGLDKYINELIDLEKRGVLPNKILLSGQKGLGKSTLAYHIINYILSKNELDCYDVDNLEINQKNHSFITVLNKSNPNFILIDSFSEKKGVDISQIRNLISNLNKSSFNDKPRFVLIDNIETLNINSINALLKTIEEPSFNTHFILINNNKKILPTLFSRFINFKISLSNKESLDISDKLLDGNLYKLINEDLINYYSTPGNIYHLAKFSQTNKFDLSKKDLKEFLKIIISENHYKKDSVIKYLVFDFIEFYFRKMSLSFKSEINDKYTYFLKRIFTTKKYNLDEESLFIELKEEIING